MLVERPMLLPVKMSLSGKGLSPRVMETGVIAESQISGRSRWRGELEVESVVDGMSSDCGCAWNDRIIV